MVATMSYRANFLSKIILMMLTYVVQIFAWTIFFTRFTTLSSWTIQDQLLMISVIWMASCLQQLFSSGIMYLNYYILSGRLDYYLTMPRNVLWHIAAEKPDITGISTIFIAISALLWSGYGSHILAYLLCVVLCSMIFFGFYVFLQTLTFYAGEIASSAGILMWLLHDTAFYPQKVFKGFTAIIFKTLIPVYFLGAVPVAIIAHGHYDQIAWLTLIALFFFIGSIWFFNHGLKRYESGGLMGTKL
jgi:ABC-2 type transport system permease protein